MLNTRRGKTLRTHPVTKPSLVQWLTMTHDFLLRHLRPLRKTCERQLRQSFIKTVSYHNPSSPCHFSHECKRFQSFLSRYLSAPQTLPALRRVSPCFHYMFQVCIRTRLWTELSISKAVLFIHSNVWISHNSWRYCDFAHVYSTIISTIDIWQQKQIYIYI